MLDLESPRWRELAQAFGSAEDIPRLLQALATMDGERERLELWAGVWGTLAPDEVAITGAYAAVPHLIAISATRGAAERASAIHVATVVEIARHAAGAPPIPGDLVEAYADAIESLPLCVAALAAEPWDVATAQVMAAALLAGKRQPALAKAILSLEDVR